MIALLKNGSEETQFVQQRFLAMLPQIAGKLCEPFGMRGPKLVPS